MTLGKIEALSLASSEQNPLEQKMYQLFTDIQKRVDEYDSAWGKSHERNEDLAKLKEQLTEAMLMSNRHEELIKFLNNRRQLVLNGDCHRNKNPNTWFKVNRQGNSRYLTLLNDLERLVVQHWVANDPTAQQRESDKYQLQKSFKTIEKSLKEELTILNDSYNNSNKLKTFFYETAKKDVSDLFPLLDGDLVTDPKALKKLLEKIRQTTSLPGHVAAIAKQLLTVGEELRLHMPSNKPPSVV